MDDLRQRLTIFSLMALPLGLVLAPGCGLEAEPPCEVQEDEGECPNACEAGEAAYKMSCAGPGDCQCGFYCKASTQTCAYYQGDNEGCLCGGVAMVAPCEVLEGECPNTCEAGKAAYEEPCQAPLDCQCGFNCNPSTLTCAYYQGDNEGCLCGDVAMVEPLPGIPVLGTGANDLSGIEMTEVGNSSDGLEVPRDLAFNPTVPGELWVANLAATRGDERMVVYQNAGTSTQTSTSYNSQGSKHFFASPSSLAFGLTGEFATSHETDDFTQGPEGTPKDFMGPTLYSTQKPQYDAGHGGHLDMLHNSPLGMGIAWETERVYWVFDGYHDSITRYDFKDDHGLGGTDHEDGVVRRYVQGGVKRLANVPSHMVFDPNSALLYIADTGNNRIAVLDTESGTTGASISPNYDGDMQNQVNGADLWTLIEGADVEMSAPSGIALHEGMLFVSDNDTSRILAFDLEDGELVDWVDTGLASGSIMGIDFDSDGSLWVVDAIADRIYRITEKP
jgi:hypothetical protein